MAKRRRKQLGSDNFRALAQNFYSSAWNNFTQGERERGRPNPCRLIEHYTDVVAEASVASAVAHEAGDNALAERALKLASTATHAQRGAVAACRLGARRTQ